MTSILSLPDEIIKTIFIENDKKELMCSYIRICKFFYRLAIELKSTSFEIIDVDDFLGITSGVIMTLTFIKELSLLGESLYKYNSLITEEAILHLTSLEILKLGENSIISNDCLCKLTTLKELDIFYASCITDKGVSTLTNLRKIKCSMEITGEGLMNLTSLTRLECATDYSNLFSFDNYLQMSPNLTHFRSISTINGKYLQNLQSLTYLDVLHYNNTPDWSKMPISLIRLNVGSNSGLTDNALEKFTNLTYLNLYGTKNITKNSVNKLILLDTLVANPSWFEENKLQ